MVGLSTRIFESFLDDELVNYEAKDDSYESDKNSRLSRNSSISFIPHSFKSFHILCFFSSDFGITEIIVL